MTAPNHVTEQNVTDIHTASTSSKHSQADKIVSEKEEDKGCSDREIENSSSDESHPTKTSTPNTSFKIDASTDITGGDLYSTQTQLRNHPEAVINSPDREFLRQSQGPEFAIVFDLPFDFPAKEKHVLKTESEISTDDDRYRQTTTDDADESFVSARKSSASLSSTSGDSDSNSEKQSGSYVLSDKDSKSHKYKQPKENREEEPQRQNTLKNDEAELLTSAHVDIIVETPQELIKASDSSSSSSEEDIPDVPTMNTKSIKNKRKSSSSSIDSNKDKSKESSSFSDATSDLDKSGDSTRPITTEYGMGDTFQNKDLEMAYKNILEGILS